MQFNVEPDEKHSTGIMGLFNSKTTLAEALSSAKGGDLINLEPGEYELSADVQLDLSQQFVNINRLNPESQIVKMYKNCGLKQGPAKPLILRSTTGNPRDVIIKGAILLTSGVVVFEDITYQNHLDEMGLLAQNESHAVFINCIIAKSVNDESVIFSNSEGSKFLFDSCLINGTSKRANVYFTGISYFNSCKIETILVLKEVCMAILFSCIVNSIEAYDDSSMITYNDKFVGDYYYAQDEANIAFASSTVVLNDEPSFAQAKDNAKIIGNNVVFEGVEKIPRVDLQDNATVNIRIANQTGFFAGTQVMLVGQEDNTAPTDYVEANDDQQSQSYEQAITVSNNDEFINALQTAYQGTTIYLNPGEYAINDNNDVLSLSNLHFVGSDSNKPTNTILHIGDTIVSGFGAKLCFENIWFINDKSDGSAYFYTDGKASNLIIRNCIFTGVEAESGGCVAAAIADDSRIDLEHVAILSSKNNVYPSVLARSNAVIKISNCNGLMLGSDDTSQIEVINSEIQQIFTQKDSKIFIDNCTILKKIMPADNSTISISNSTLDYKDAASKYPEIIADQHAMVKLDDVTVLNSHRNLEFLVIHDSKLVLNLKEYDEKFPVEICCHNKEKQIFNISGNNFNFSKAKDDKDVNIPKQQE